MGERRTSLPSPAIIVAALALVAALAGTALAGTDTTTSAISKKKVKKIATKQINKLAPGLSVANADTVGGKPPGAFAPSSSEPYRVVGTSGQPQFQNGWHNNDATNSSTAFYKDPLGVVHLKGFLTGGASASVAFTLPAGYRPAKALFMPAAQPPASPALLRVETDGSVRLYGTGGSPAIGIAGLTFRAGQ
jgi:hypothetical protein